MSLSKAFFAGADFVERHPARYDISNTTIPTDTGPGARGCMWGWAGYFYEHGLRGMPVRTLTIPSKIDQEVIHHWPALRFHLAPATTDGHALDCRRAEDAPAIMRMIGNLLALKESGRPVDVPTMADIREMYSNAMATAHHWHPISTVPATTTVVSYDEIAPLAAAEQIEYKQAA